MMASNNQPPPRTPFKPAASTSAPPSSFHQQREALVGDIAIVCPHCPSTLPPPPNFPLPTYKLNIVLTNFGLMHVEQAMEQVLQNINKLNRSLEGVIAVGNEFGAVEALWSQFENVMAKQPEQGENGEAEGDEAAEEEEEEQADAREGSKSGGSK
ncbi:MAG: hypothetical protein Q9210_001734 [Variospora velana]